MSNPNRTEYMGPSLNGPGIMWVNSIPRPSLSDAAFKKWYEEVHIPDIIKAKSGKDGCTAAWRFKCQDNRRLRPYLALYSVPDMSFVQSPEFRQISQHHDSLPEGGPSQKFVDFDTRFYQRIQVFEKPHTTPGIGKVIKSTAMQPGHGMDDEYNSWYTEEHLEQVSHMVGWLRSTRFELIFKVQSKDDANQEPAPKYLAIHEFEAGTEVQRLRKEEWTGMTKRMVDNAVKIDEATFEYLWGMGDDDARL